MKRETAVLLGVIATLSIGLCGMTAALAVVIALRPSPGPPAPVAPIDSATATPPAPLAAPGPTAASPPPPPPKPVAEEWTTRQDPLGFSLEAPKDWTVEADKTTGRVKLTSPRGDRIEIWPVFVPAALDDQGAARVVRHLAAKVAPDEEWADADAPAKGVARSLGSKKGLALFTWVATSEGAAARLHVVKLVDASSEATASRILASFKVVGKKSDPTAIHYVKWTDPTESAFTIEVPETWKTQGGLKRVAPVDVRAAIVTTSPDDAMAVAAGDVSIPTYSEPTRLGESLGFTEGKPYNPGGTPMIIRRYVPGLAFAKEYVNARIAPRVEGFEIVKERERPDVVAVYNQQLQASAGMGSSAYITAGEVAFTGSVKGQKVRGSYFAATRRSTLESPGIEPIKLWNVILLYGWIAVEKNAARAQEVLDHMIRTFAQNPEWVKMQQGITMESVRIQHETNEAISKTISDSYWKRQASDSEISRRRSNAMLGVEDTVDPQSGRELKVWSGSNYYWLDDKGTVVGTNTSDAPGIEFRELVRRP